MKITILDDYLSGSLGLGRTLNGLTFGNMGLG